MIHRHEIRVRYGETDQMGVVHHRVYALYFEEARTELMRALGVTYADLERRGFLLPLIEFHAKYLRGPRYDDRLVLEARLTMLRGVRLRLDYRMLDAGDGTLLAEGFTVHACTDPDLKPVRLPADVRQAFQEAIQEPPAED